MKLRSLHPECHLCGRRSHLHVGWKREQETHPCIWMRDPFLNLITLDNSSLIMEVNVNWMWAAYTSCSLMTSLSFLFNDSGNFIWPDDELIRGQLLAVTVPCVSCVFNRFHCVTDCKTERRITKTGHRKEPGCSRDKILMTHEGDQNTLSLFFVVFFVVFSSRSPPGWRFGWSHLQEREERGKRVKFSEHVSKVVSDKKKRDWHAKSRNANQEKREQETRTTFSFEEIIWVRRRTGQRKTERKTEEK